MTVTAAGRRGSAPSPVDASAAVGNGAVGGMLSVAEIQQALREMRSRHPAATGQPVHPPGVVPDQPAAEEMSRRSLQVRERGSVRGDTAIWGPLGRGDTSPDLLPEHGDMAAADALSLSGSAGVGSRWVVVVAAHSGAGASTVALAIADAAAGPSGRRAHLIDAAPSGRCGLGAATAAELGCDATGAWRRGARGAVTIDRRADDVDTSRWPTPPVGGADLTVLDLGTPRPAQLARLTSGPARLIVVCRATVPGVRAAEQLLTTLAGSTIAVAAVGPARWPGEVTASTGPRLEQVREAGRVVTVPLDRHLQVSGPTSADLPTRAFRAGLALLGLVETGDAIQRRGPGRSTPTWSASPPMPASATSARSSAPAASAASLLSPRRRNGARR